MLICYVNHKLEHHKGLGSSPSTISLAVEVFSFLPRVATQVYSPWSESWTSMIASLRSFPSEVNLCLGLSLKLLPSFIHVVMAVDGDTSHSNTAEDPMDSPSWSTMFLSSLMNFSGTALSWNPANAGSSGGLPPPPGLPLPLPPPGEGVPLAAVLKNYIFFSFI